MRPRNVTRNATWIFPLLVCSMWLLTSASAASGDDDRPQFGPWSAPVNLGPAINTAAFEQGPAISKDGLSLYFHSQRPGGFGGFDIYVAQRPSVNDAWGTPQNLGPNINTSSGEFAPAFSLDGHRLYFQSNRPGGFGGQDIYVSRRHNKRDDFGWQPPENLGSGVNTAAQELQPVAPFEDNETGVITLYFTSNRPGGLGGDDIYATTLQPDETFGPAVLVPELSSPASDSGPALRRDGLEMFLASDRLGSIIGPNGLPSTDLWISTRPSTSDPWSTPVNLGPVVNSVFIDGGPELSFDGTALYFFSGRAGGFGIFDLWVTTRTKLPELDEDKE